ncbi:MAG: ABC transporter substrate-binding protein, partial [Anaerolineales bacterium]
SNILLDKNDKAFLADFGIARIMGDQKFTATGTLIGTPAYMSPEQGTGEELSKESDIYSLGVVAFEMITGQVPYDAPTPIGIVHKQVYDPIPDIADLVDDVPESTQEVIDTALAKSPDSRYSSADALVTALRGALVALEAADPTLKEIEVADPNDEDKAQYAATVMMEEPPKTEELDQATGLMEATKAAQQEEELSATIVDPGIEDQLEEVESERKIPIWGVVIGVVAVIGIVGVILSQVIDFGSSTSEPLPTQSSSDPDPTETESSSDSDPDPTETESSSEVDSGYSARTVGVANPQSSDGVIVIWDAGGDADIELVAVDGEGAWRTGTGRNLPSSDESQTADYYMIVDVDDEFMYRGTPTSEVVIELEYLDQGIDRFRLEYDAVTGGPNGYGPFKETDWVAKTDSGEFKVAVFHLDDAYFANRVHDGDFRLNDDADGFETIRSVSVTLPSFEEAKRNAVEYECDDPLGCVTYAEGEPVRLASALVISGPNIQLGQDSQYGVEIAMDFKGNVLGHPLELQAEDDGCSAEGGQTAGQKIVSDPTILGVVGTSCSGAGVPMSEVISGAGYFMVSPSNTSPALTDPDQAWNAGYYRTAHNDLVQGAEVANFAYNELGLTYAAAIHDGDPYTEGLANAFRTSFESLGGEIVEFTAISKGDTDMLPVLTAVSAAGPPEFLYFPIFNPECPLIAKQAEQLEGLEDTILAAADGCMSNDIIEAFGGISGGMYFSGPDFGFSGTEYNKFLAAYKEKVGSAPISVFHAHAYDATNIIINCIEEVGVVDGGALHVGRQAMRDCLAATSGHAGITGSLTCDAYGDCADPKITISVIEGGSFYPIWP